MVITIEYLNGLQDAAEADEVVVVPSSCVDGVLLGIEARYSNDNVRVLRKVWDSDFENSILTPCQMWVEIGKAMLATKKALMETVVMEEAALRG